MAGFGGAVKLTGEDAYRAALKKITQNLKEVSSEMKLVSSQYDKGDKSEAALSKQTEVLNKALAEQKKKFDTIKAAYDKFEPQVAKMKDEHAELVKEYEKEKQKLSEIETTLGKSSKEYKDQAKAVEDLSKKVDDSAKANDAAEKTLSEMRVEMNKAQTEVNKTARKIDELGKEEDDTTKDTKELGESIKESGNAAEKSEGGFTVMKGALASLVADGFRLATDAAKKLTTAVINAGQAADELNTTSKQSGFSTEMLQKFNYAAELIDVDTETIISAARKMKKNMTSENADTVKAFEKLGVSVRDSNGELRDSEAVFFEVVEGLSRISNETDRDTTAMKLFGKGADELAGIIDDGGEAFRKYGKEAEDLGLILGQDTLDAANDFNDSIDKIKSTAKGAFSAIGSEIAKELMPFVERAQKKIQSLVKSEDFQDLKKKAVDAIGTVFKTIYNLFIFVKDNWRPIVTALAAIAAGLVAFKIASVISATVSAISGFITAIKTAESVTAAFNATLGLNPLTLVAAGLAAVVGGLMALDSALKGSEDSWTNTNKKMIEFIDGTRETADSFRKARDAAAEQTDAQIANVEYVEKNLLPQLQNIIDANGNVKEGEEARAQFILGELNKALGTEYKSLSDIVGANGEIEQSIYDVINAKKAQIYLENYEQTWKQALDEVTDAETAQAQAAQLLSQRQSELDSAKAESAKYEQLYREAAENGWQEEMSLYNTKWQWARENVAEAQKNYDEQKAIYDESEKNVKMYYDTIDRYESASVAVQEGNTQKAIDLLSIYSKGFQTATSVMEKSADEQKEILGQQVIDTQVKLKLLTDDYSKSQSKMTDEEKRQTEARIDQAKKEAAAAKEEFKNVGGNMITGTAEGIDGSKYKLTAEMQDSVQKAVLAAENTAYSGGYDVGTNAGSGLAKGLSDMTYAVVTSAGNIAMSAVSKMKATLQEKSPSKLTRQIGAYFGEGFAIGINDAAKEANSAAAQMSRSTVNALTTIKAPSVSAAAEAKRNEVSMVAAFKEALSEMKIELDDRVAGKFVERTVARAIY